MFGIADYGAFCAAVLVFLALPGPGTFALLGSTGQGGLRAGARPRPSGGLPGTARRGALLHRRRRAPRRPLEALG